MDILAAAIPVEDHPLIAVLQAGRGRLAAVKFRAESKVWRSSSQPVVCDLKGLFEMMEGPTLVAGELDAEQRHALSDRRKHIILASPANCLRRPSYLAELAWKRFTNSESDDPLALAPIYLHVADALPD